jgi:serine/threonine protein kinase
MSDNLIGKYKILRLIGEGGMASVYEAVHIVLRNKVAIKILNPILSSNAQIRERFRNEARLMASLDHPNIAKVIDFDEQPQRLSIIMEFLNGVNLNEKIKLNGPLSQKEIVDVFIQSLSALQYAHDNGIVHRDINPSNIFILPNGQVKILDFGVAKLFSQGIGVTQTGTQLGTPSYMSPEQVKADKSIDHRSDIYSLGVSMFFAINGKAPYNSSTDSVYNTYTKIVNEPLPEFAIYSVFKNVVLKACQKRIEDRFQNCLDLAHALQLAAEDGSRSTSKSFKDRLTFFKPNVKNKLPGNRKAVISGIENSKKQSLNLLVTVISIVVGLIVSIFLVFSIQENERLLNEINSYETYRNDRESLETEKARLIKALLLQRKYGEESLIRELKFNSGKLEIGTLQKLLREGDSYKETKKKIHHSNAKSAKIEPKISDKKKENKKLAEKWDLEKKEKEAKERKIKSEKEKKRKKSSDYEI